jgi:demethylspheroidene O-methyltransferase
MGVRESALDSVNVNGQSAEMPLTLSDRLLAWRDRIQGSERFQRWAASFPLTRPIALARSRALFDLTAGFVYTQTLTACVQIGLFEYLAEKPRTLAEVANHANLPLEETGRLLRAAMALKLVQERSHKRFGNGPLGAPMIGNTALNRMIEHNALLYNDLRNPVELLRSAGPRNRLVLDAFPYTSVNNPETFQRSVVEEYSRLMADTVEPIARELLDTYSLEGVSSLLDVGGGEGSFCAAVAARYLNIKLGLFDLPAVIEGARPRLEKMGFEGRVTFHGGNFHADPIPQGHQIVTLLRVLLDHDDASVLKLLRKVRAAVATGGRVLIVEPFAGVKGAEVVGDVYFGFYLRAMGRGRARTIDELRTLLGQADFSSVRVVKTRYPVYAGMLVAEP